MNLILIRHAQSKGNKTNVVQGQTCAGLSDIGTMQAEELSKALQDIKLNAIYSSDLGRAIQTAKPTARDLNLEIKFEPELREAHFGIWEGLTYEQVKETYHNEYTAWHENYFIRPHWFESYESHHKRVSTVIKKILSSHPKHETIAIFTHGGSIKTQIGFFMNLNGKELTQYKTKNCSLTAIHFNSSLKYEDGKIIYYNRQVISYSESPGCK